jgi:hypothetical protein
MALRVELWDSDRLVDGVEEWWDDVERALAEANDDYPVLRAVSPYGELRLARALLGELEEECHRLATGAATQRGRALLLKIGALCAQAASNDAAELRFNGD